MSKYHTFEEDFIDDSVVTLKDQDGKVLGRVQRVGGGPTWAVYIEGVPDVAALRLDRQEAERCLSKVWNL